MSALRILVVGYGYLGARLAGRLHEDGHAVVAVHRGAADAGGQVPVLSGDVASPASLESVRSHFPNPDLIVHCASSSRGGAEAYREVFVEGLRHLGTVFPEAPVIFTSSTSVYAQTDGSVVDEQSETEPDRETGRLLLEAEAMARYRRGIVLRLAGLYGPGRSVHLQRMLSGTATIEAGEKSRYLNQIHRDDAAAAVRHLVRCGLAEQAGSVFNVVDDTPLTQRECYEALAHRFGLPVPAESPPDPGRKRGLTDKIVSNQALRATGWVPEYPSFLDAVERDPELVPSIQRRIREEG